MSDNNAWDGCVHGYLPSALCPQCEITRLTADNQRMRAALDRIACGYWNETACHSIAREALAPLEKLNPGESDPRD